MFKRAVNLTYQFSIPAENCFSRSRKSLACKTAIKCFRNSRLALRKIKTLFLNFKREFKKIERNESQFFLSKSSTRLKKGTKLTFCILGIFILADKMKT